ncbi:MAG TPA: AN1-type zinc finger domain-containing protein [Nitrososphaerales archaeon]|nr:AN1-type zinc finger domain-containing protein [Nitrososphaerales archaeon]
MQCHFCDEVKDGLPFRCNYCGESFCGEHRLPENHACPRVGGPKQPGYAQVRRYAPAPSDRRNVPYVRSSRSRFRLRYAGIFSKTEEKHILASSFVMVLVGISIDLLLPNSLLLHGPSSAAYLLLAVPGFLISFLGHELSHKFLARRHGLWAEFRANLYGLMLTAVSAVFPFKFLAPGQVNIQGNGSKEVLGAIGLIGPGFNIALGSLLFVLSRFSGVFFGTILLELASFNGWLAVVNMIPFGSLDGTRVFAWDKTRWMIALAGSIVVVGLSYYYLGYF